MRSLAGEVDERSLSILDLMDEVEYRRVQGAEDLEEIGRLRARSYKMYGIMDRDDPIIDEIDFHSHARVYAIYYREQLASTIRLHHVVSEERHGSSVDIFPDVLNPLLDQGLTFIDCVRHAADPELIGELPLPFITLRLVAMACHYFGADYTLAPVKKSHYAFYRRAFGATQFAEARKHEGICEPIGLFASKYDIMYERVTRRYPFFQSLDKERELLFAPLDSFAVPPLAIRPTARFAIERGLNHHAAA